MEPTINSVTVSNTFNTATAGTPAELRDSCAQGTPEEACKNTLTTVTTKVTYPPGAIQYCAGPIVFGLSSDVNAEGYLSPSWPGGDYEQNCGAFQGCPQTGPCVTEISGYPFVYGLARNCTNTSYDVETSIEFLGNGTSYSKTYPVSIPIPQACENGGVGGSGGNNGRGNNGGGGTTASNITMKSGSATIKHANGNEQTCEHTCPSDITFGVGDMILTGPGTYLKITTEIGTVLLGPNTRIGPLTKKQVEINGGKASFKLLPTDCPILVASPIPLDGFSTKVGTFATIRTPCKNADVVVAGGAKVETVTNLGNTTEVKAGSKPPVAVGKNDFTNVKNGRVEQPLRLKLKPCSLAQVGFGAFCPH
ncbi:MAG TPA: hypothetical protein VEJ23_00230 [Solirubrobacteraceae bacterium]|nr:hypothetical protein [Solirubrobacteraceae bacterium]